MLLMICLIVCSQWIFGRRPTIMPVDLCPPTYTQHRHEHSKMHTHARAHAHRHTDTKTITFGTHTHTLSHILSVSPVADVSIMLMGRDRDSSCCSAVDICLAVCTRV